MIGRPAGVNSDSEERRRRAPMLCLCSPRSPPYSTMYVITNLGVDHDGKCQCAALDGHLALSNIYILGKPCATPRPFGNVEKMINVLKVTYVYRAEREVHWRAWQLADCWVWTKRSERQMHGLRPAPSLQGHVLLGERPVALSSSSSSSPWCIGNWRNP